MSGSLTFILMEEELFGSDVAIEMPWCRFALLCDDCRDARARSGTDCVSVE